MSSIDWIFVGIAGSCLLLFLVFAYLRRLRHGQRLPRSFYVIVGTLLILFIGAFATGSFVFVRLIYTALIIWALVMMGGFGDRRASAQEKNENRDLYR